MTEQNEEQDNTRRDIAKAIRAVGKPAAAAFAALHPVVGTVFGFLAEIGAGLVEGLGVSEGLESLRRMAQDPVEYIKRADLDAQVDDVVGEIEDQG